MTSRRIVAALALLCCTSAAGCSGPDATGTTGPAASTASSAGSTAPTDRVLDMARNDTRADSVYPEVGGPLVDALHYDLDLDWQPERDHLTGHEVLTFRATAEAEQIPLDFTDALTLSEVTVDGTAATFEVAGNDLLIHHAVSEDETYEVAFDYAGTPGPADAPSRRSDFSAGLGWHVTDKHETWTMQEPYGAFTWYAVNDQPSDKALYDFTLTVPAPWSGVANGVLTSSTVKNGKRVNRWTLSEPASAYLVTAAFGDYQHTDLTSRSGVPIQVWAPSDGEATPGQTAFAPKAIDWLEKILGPYPFDSFGVVVVDNDSGMETQTMVTLGNTRYSLSPEVMVHEAAHHWYGDTVTPDDWSDVWMNEGMAMYLQGMWEAEQEGIPISRKIDGWAGFESSLRASSGPPGAYLASHFGDGNIYYGPALMWQELRERIGDQAFFRVLREWPAQHANSTADRATYVDWIEATTGEELSDFFDAWLLGRTTPPRN